MMKRFLAAALAVTLALTICACATPESAPDSGTVTPEASDYAGGTVTAVPPTQEDGASASEVLGALPGGTYTNRNAHIFCKLDDSWLFYNESQLMELNGMLSEGGSGDVAALAESGSAVYDMYAISADGLMTMNVTYQNLGLLSGSSMTAQEYVELAAAQLPADLTAGGFTDVEVQVSASDIAAESNCPTLLVTAKLQESEMYERMVCLQSGNYIYCVTLCSFTKDMTADMAALFHTVR